MIGYYVHHAGRGHLSHAMSICAHISEPVTILSSLTRPSGWARSWLPLPPDNACAHPVDPSAGGQLHWAPLGDRGLQDRMAHIANWVARERPSALLVDVSVEVAAFARLLGVPVITMALPGLRHDKAHRLGYSLSDAIVAPWFEQFSALCPDLKRYGDKVHYVGAISRFDARPPAISRRGPRLRALVLQGRGSIDAKPDFASAAAATPSWSWAYLGPGHWNEDPWHEICRADVVITHAGLGALAEIAAARKPAIVIPEPRPHNEQFTTAATLAAEGLAVVRRAAPLAYEWADLLDTARALGGSRWSAWSSGSGAPDAAQILVDCAQAQRVDR